MTATITRMTKEQLDQLAALNKQRDPLQENLLKEAERLFDIWSDLDPVRHGSRQFKGAELLPVNQWDEQEIRISYEVGCGCSGHNYDSEETTLPIEAFLNSEWEDEAKAKIEDRKQEAQRARQGETERREREQLATLSAKYK
jgi:hypothetical protein